MATTGNKRQVMLQALVAQRNLALYMLEEALIEKEEQEKRRKTKQRKPRKCWVRHYLSERPLHGHFESLMNSLREHDADLFKNFTRMDEEFFNQMVERLTPRLQKQDTFMRKALPVGLRLAITLRFLATGAQYKDMAYNWRVAPNTICGIIPETCEAIIAEYRNEALKLPDNPKDWKEVAKGFSTKWHFEHTIGAIDGKHVRIQNMKYGGSHYFNYKKFYSINLMAIVDWNYKFMALDVGAYGADSDGGVFRNSKIFEMYDKNLVNLPAPEPLYENGPKVPYFLVGDAAFAHRKWLQKPFQTRGMTRSQKIFNYRMSRARRIVENAFGILASRYVSLQ